MPSCIIGCSSDDENHRNYIQKYSKRIFSMQNQSNGIIHTQSYPLSHTTPLQVFELPSFENFVLPNILASLQIRFQFLTNEVQNLKKELASARAEMEEVKQLAKMGHTSPTSILLKDRAGKIRKEYTKHIACPSRQCRSKYSSRIALRAHIRKTHPDISLSASQ